MKTIKVTLLFIGMIFCTLAAAQKPMIEVNNDKKKINVHELGLPESMNLNNVLNMLPELLSRPTAEWQLESYSIEINSVNVGDARDAVLRQLRIADIQYIEVSENPITSYQNNGQGGTINIKLIKPEENDKINGSVSISGSYPLDVCPSLNIGYRKNKFSIQALAIGEFFNQKNIIKDIDDKTTGEYKSTSTDTKFVTEMAMILLEYNPNVNNEFILSLAENWKKENSVSLEQTTVSGTAAQSSQQTSENKLTNLFVKLEYNHYFGADSKQKDEKSRLKFETTATYKPADKTISQILYTSMEDDKSNSVAGKLEYLLPLARQVNAQKMDIKAGTNFNFSFANEYNKLKVTGLNECYNLNTKALTTFISPYLQAEYIKDNISFKGTCEYQYFQYNVERNNQHQFMQYYEKNDEFRTCNKSVTGKLMAGYRFAPNQTIRLIAERTIRRPSSSQIYPYLVFSPDDLSYIKGNPDLKPLLSHEFTIDYITEVDNKTHSVMMNMGLSYIQVNDVITKSGKMPLELLRAFDEYYTFLNEGNNHIAKANFMMFYKRKVFSILFTSNVFNNIGSKDYTSSDHYTYFNAKIVPSFRFKYGWYLSASMTYNSEVIKSNEILGNNLYSGLVVSKSFKSFDISAYAQISLLKNTKDYSYVNNSEIVTTYNAISNVFGVEFRYQF